MDMQNHYSKDRFCFIQKSWMLRYGILNEVEIHFSDIENIDIIKRENKRRQYYT